MTEQEIRRLMRKNPERGNHALFDTYYHYVYAIVFRKINGTGTREDIEECVIDVFAEVMRHFQDVQEGSLKAYLAAAARNRALNVCRSLSAKSRQTVSIDDDNFTELISSQDVEETAIRSEQTARLLACIRELGEPDSTIVIQKYFYGHGSKEIAEIVDCTPGTVRVRCSRALDRLRTMFGGEA